MPIRPWTISHDSVWVTTRIFTLNKLHSTSATGDKSGDFVYLNVPNWVNIIALTPSKEVVLVRQYRHGSQQVTLEIPGGMCDADEDFISAAARELLEETGYSGDSGALIGVVDPNPAFQNNRCATVLFTNVRQVSVQDLDPHEEIEIDTAPLSDIKRMINDGEITHSLVVAAFYHYFMRDDS